MFLNKLQFFNILLADLLCTMMMMRNKSRNPAVTAVVTQTAIVYKIFQSPPEREGNDKIFIKAFKHRVNIAIVREWTDLSTRRAQECLFIVNTFNRE